MDDLKSIQRAKARLNRFAEKIGEIPIEILEKEAPRIQAEAISITPFYEGKLQQSVFARVKRGNALATLEVGAQAFSPRGYDYAPIQHERTDFDHPVKGQAKFIAIPFEKGIRRIKYTLRREVKRAAQQGGGSK